MTHYQDHGQANHWWEGANFYVAAFLAAILIAFIVFGEKP